MLSKVGIHDAESTSRLGVSKLPGVHLVTVSFSIKPAGQTFLEGFFLAR
jgi:hypothetical protein